MVDKVTNLDWWSPVFLKHQQGSQELPTWRIISVSKQLVTPTSKPFGRDEGEQPQESGLNDHHGGMILQVPSLLF